MSNGNRERTLGIDLGTTNSAAAILQEGKPTIIPSAEGPTLAGKMFPSIFAITKDGQLLVGEPARRQAITNPEGTVREIKRQMGTDYKVKIYGKEYTPQQISGFILQKILRDAETFLSEKITKAVITVPANFNDNQRQATIDAGEIAGLDVTRIINEPTAAALAYGLDKADQELKIVVFSFGGGTNDTTVMEFGGGVFAVLATSGDTKTGGTDLDQAIMDYIISEFKRETGIDLKGDMKAIVRLKDAAEQAKIELSNLITTEINLPYITADATGPKNLQITLTRAKLEQLTRPIVERIRAPILKTLSDAKLTPVQIDKIILIGGQTKMPLVQQFIEDIIGKKPERGIDPMECVAIGAAIQGAILTGEISDIVLLDITPLSLGVETLGGVFTKIIERNTTIPVKQSQIFSTAADAQPSVTIHVLQGERSMAKDAISLGQFDLTASTKLSPTEKNRLIKEADQFGEQDKRAKEEAEMRNTADSLIYTSEKTLSEIGDKISEDQKHKVQEALNALKDALKTGGLSELGAKVEELQRVVQEAGTAVYQQATAQRAPQQQSSQGASRPEEGQQGNKTVDAEFKVVDEEKE
jgi:molecular chaperone DnaK